MSMTTQQLRQIYKPLRVGDDTSNHVGGHISYGAPSYNAPSHTVASNDMVSYLSLFRLWFACLTQNLSESFAGSISRGCGYLRAYESKALQDAADIASGKTRAPALIPESARAPEAPKIMLGRRSKRILARGLPATRQYGWFRYASPRTLNGHQFYELLSRLSVHGRAVVYRLEYKRRLCTRRPRNALLCQRAPLVHSASKNLGICAAHLWPN